MHFLLFLIAFPIFGLLFGWAMRLGARWVLGVSLHRRLPWIFCVAVFCVQAIFVMLGLNKHPIAHVAAGFLVQLGLGGWFFGRFAVDKEGRAPGFVGGLKVTGAAFLILMAPLAPMTWIAGAVLLTSS